MKTIDSITQFRAREPVAFRALPEAYQNDDCLRFIIFSGIITVVPKPGQESALGNFKFAYSDAENRWIPIL